MKKMSQEVWSHLVPLLPELSSIYDDHRLKVLTQIDRVLASEGLSWQAIADMLPEPAWSPASVIAAVDCIERYPDLRGVAHAAQFLAECRDRAKAHKQVYLSPRQSAWLANLWEQAREHEVQLARERGCEPLVQPKRKPRTTTKPKTKVKGNVVQLIHVGASQ